MVRKTNRESLPIRKTTYTAFSVLHASTYDLDDSLPMQILQEECNIDIEFQSVMSAELSEKRNLLLNSGEYPELLIKSGITTSEMSDYGRQGILIPLGFLAMNWRLQIGLLIGSI